MKLEAELAVKDLNFCNWRQKVILVLQIGMEFIYSFDSLKVISDIKVYQLQNLLVGINAKELGWFYCYVE